MPRDRSIRSVLIIGSGPIIIGQACEFDYSGSQASRSLREEGIEVVLINSNPATIMTDPVTADHIYLKPLNKSSIKYILERHNIDAVLPTMGGQTALNLAIDCDKAGLWEHFGVRIIGVDIDAIETTENREKFRLKMHELKCLSGGDRHFISQGQGNCPGDRLSFGDPTLLHAWRAWRRFCATS